MGIRHHHGNLIDHCKICPLTWLLGKDVKESHFFCHRSSLLAGGCRMPHGDTQPRERFRLCHGNRRPLAAGCGFAPVLFSAYEFVFITSGNHSSSVKTPVMALRRQAGESSPFMACGDTCFHGMGDSSPIFQSSSSHPQILPLLKLVR